MNQKIYHSKIIIDCVSMYLESRYTIRALRMRIHKSKKEKKKSDKNIQAAVPFSMYMYQCRPLVLAPNITTVPYANPKPCAFSSAMPNRSRNTSLSLYSGNSSVP